MATDIGIVRGIIELQDNFTSVVDQAASKVVASGAKIKRLGDELTDVGSKLTRTVTLPIIAIGGVAIKAASDFESSFTGVIKTVNDATDEFGNLTVIGEQLRQGFRDMAQEIPINVNELNRIGEAAGQLGIESENILDFTRVMADLGQTTNLSADEAASALARLANITQMPQSEFERLGSTIVALGNNFATTEREITEMSLRIAGAGSQIGLTEGQILAVATALSSVGIQAEAGGSAISKVMIEMALSVSTGTGNLQNFADVAGLSAAEFQRAFRDDAATAVNAFITGLGNMQESGGDVLQVLDSMEISEVRMRDALLRTAGAGDLLTRALDLQSVAWDENSALTKEAEQRYKTFESQLQLFWNRLKDVAITLGQSLLPILSDVLDASEPVIDVLAGMAKLFSDIPRPIQIVVTGLAALAAAAGPVLVVVGSLTAAWGAFAASTIGAALIPALGSLVAIITGPVGWIAAGVLLLASIKPVRDFVVNLTKAVIDLGSKAVSAVVDWFRDWWRSTRDVRDFLDDLYTLIRQRVVRAIEDLVKSARLFVSQAVEMGRRIRDSIIQFGNWSGITETINTQIDLMGRTVKELGERLGLVNDTGRSWTSTLAGIAATLLIVNPATRGMVVSVADMVAEVQRAVDVNRISLIPTLDLSTKAYNEGSVSVSEMDQAYQDMVTSMESSSDEFETNHDRVTDLGEVTAGTTDRIVDFGDSLSDVDFSTFGDNLTLTTDDVFDFGSTLTDFSTDASDFGANFGALSGVLNDFRVSTTDAGDGVGELAEDVTDAADVVSQSTTEWSTLTDTLAAGIGQVITSGGSLSDTLSGMFSEQARSNLAGFVDTFASGFSEALESGKTAAEATAEAWQGSKGKITGVANAIVAAMAAAAGETQDIWNAALTAIVSFATGDWVSTIIAVVGIVIGIMDKINDDVNKTVEGLNAAFDSLVDGSFQDILNLSSLIFQAFTNVTSFGQVDLEAINTIKDRFREFLDAAIALGDQGTLAIDSLVNALVGYSGSIESLRNAIPALADVTRETVAEMASVLADRARFIGQETGDMVAGLEQLLSSTAQLTQGEVQFAAESVVQAFNMMVVSGAPLSDIIAELGPLFADLSMRSVDMGDTITATEAGIFDAFSELGGLFDILATDHMQAVIGRLEGIGQAALASGNMGLLSASQLDVFGDRARNAFNQLIQQGATSEQAIAALAPQLQILNDLSEQYGITLDGNTQRLIDQGIEQGVVADKGLTTEDILIRGFDNVLRSLNALIEALGGIPLAFQDWTDSAEDTGRATENVITGVSEGVQSVQDGVQQLGNDILQVGTDFGTFGDAASDASSAVLDSLQSVDSAIGGVSTATDNMGSNWGATTNQMAVVWSGVAAGVSNTMSGLSNSMARDIDDVHSEWNDLMGDMNNDFGGSVIADAIQARSTELATSMSGDFNNLSTVWGVTTDGMMMDFVNTAGGIKTAWQDVTVELTKPIKPVIEPQLKPPVLIPVPKVPPIVPGDDDGDVTTDDDGGDDDTFIVDVGPPAAPDIRVGRGGARAGSNTGNRDGGRQAGGGGGTSSLNLGDRQVLDRLNGINNKMTSLITSQNHTTDAVNNLDRRLVALEARRRT